MARLLLVRHGESTWNAEDRWQGWADPPLSTAGEGQARSAAEWLASAGWGLRGVVASDLRRARRTAEIIADALGLGEVAVDAGLRERDVGAWSGLTRAEIEDRFPGVLEAWRAGRVPSPPEGEHEADFAARVTAAVERVARRGDGPLLVVAHGGVIRVLNRRLGAAPCATANLCGRWVELDGDALRADEPVALHQLDDDGVPTAV